MGKTRIEGLNGFIEVNNKYVYVYLNNGTSHLDDECVIWFYEIEDVVYKKPTSKKNGFLSLYVNITGFISNKKKEYTLILDKIDEKSIAKNDKFYVAIKSIIDVKEVKVLEVVEKEEKEKIKEEQKEIKEEKVEEKSFDEPLKEPVIEKIKEEQKINIEPKQEVIIEKKEEIKIEVTNPPIIVVGIPQEEKKNDLEEIRQIIKENNERQRSETKEEILTEPPKEVFVTTPPFEEEIAITTPVVSIEQEKKEEKVEEPVIETKQEEKNEEKQEIIAIPVSIPEEVKKTTPKEEKTEEDIVYVNVPNEKIEEVAEKVLDEEEKEETKEEIKEEKKVTSLDKLEDKAHDIEKELEKLTYKEIILSEYLDNQLDRKKIDKLIIELKKIIDKIEKLKKEILKQEKSISQDDYVKLDEGHITLLDISKSSFDEKDLDNYIDRYKEVIKKLNKIQTDTDELSKSSEEKKKEIGISDEEYEMKINQFKGVKNNKDFISKLIKETKEDLSRVKWRIERTVETHVKYKFVKRSISKQTERLAALTALNGLRPNRSKFSMIALSLFTGVSAIYDILGYDIKEVEYNELVQKEILEGLEFVDTNKARAMINSSKNQIDSIISECEKNYSNYPDFVSLKKNLLSLRKDIDSQDKELALVEDKLKEYNAGPKVKVLRHNIE